MRHIVLALTLVAAAVDPSPIERFTRAVQEYTLLRASVEAALALPKTFENYDAAAASTAELARGLRAVRKTASEGDLFTSEVGMLFRIEIRRALAAHDIDAEDLVVEMEIDTDPNGPRPRVNGDFPWSIGSAMPPCVLGVLPRLPRDLEYRFVGTDLVLIDIRSNLVVDILRDALPSLTFREHRADAGQPARAPGEVTP